MLFINQPQSCKAEYLELLELIGSMSNLFADSGKPFLHYRVAENLFCMCLKAKNLSRSDCAADASKDKLGIGIKTFLSTASGSSMQKIAEFNKRRNEYANLSEYEIIHAVSDFRNERINFTKRTHDLNEMIYHYTVRDTGIISILECNMNLIAIDNIRITKKNANTIYFEDGLSEYGFNLSKSTLYKRFYTSDVIESISVNIIENPFFVLKQLLGDAKKELVFTQEKDEPHVFLPLYSMRTQKVEEKSGLNQWNAGDRRRHHDELYIPIPRWIHINYPGFFPDNNEDTFNLELPNGKTLLAKMCQAGQKGLMSNPNKALGHWILRDVLQLPKGELVTMDKLNKIGIDSVVIYKIDNRNYSMDFAQTDSFENFTTGINEVNHDQDPL